MNRSDNLPNEITEMVQHARMPDSCPRCRGRALLIGSRVRGSDDAPLRQVYCTECGLSGPSAHLDIDAVVLWRKVVDALQDHAQAQRIRHLAADALLMVQHGTYENGVTVEGAGDEGTVQTGKVLWDLFRRATDLKIQIGATLYDNEAHYSNSES